MNEFLHHHHHQRRKQNLPHKRSKKGCLTCRKRRKKCPEDYQRWSDGTWACSACEARGQICKLPLSRKGFGTHGQQQQQRQMITSEESRPSQYNLPSPSNFNEDHDDASLPRDTPNDGTSSVAFGIDEIEHTGPLNQLAELSTLRSNNNLVNDFTLPQNQEQQHQHPQSSSTVPSTVVIEKNSSWLDTFLEEFMALTEPTLQSVARSSLSTTATTTSSLPRTAFDSLPVAISPHSSTGSERHRSETFIDKMIQSDDLDEILTKSARIYDTFFCAIVDTSKMAGNASLIDHLMDITRSNNVCKASMVSCCLAYSDVIDRELQSPRGPSRFVQYLLKGSKKSNSSGHSSTIPSRQVQKWLRYATDGFHRSKSTMSLDSKLLTLLNLRFACVCFLGAKDAFALANDIHSILSQLSVDIDYLRSTAKRGTPLSIIIQGLAFANIMDVATMKGARPAILNKAVNLDKSLELDLTVNPTADLNMVTVLSVDLAECIKRISDLSADIAEGLLTNRSEIESKSEQIKELIMKSEIEMSNDICQSISRVRSFLLQELWRQALLIQLYQDVLKLGPMAIRVQQALQSMIKLAELLEKTEEKDVAYIDVWDMSFVWFLACSVSISQEHRDFCILQLENLGCERAILDNIEAVKVLWKIMDETGQSTEWRDVLNEHDLVINYTF